MARQATGARSQENLRSDLAEYRLAATRRVSAILDAVVLDASGENYSDETHYAATYELLAIAEAATFKAAALSRGMARMDVDQSLKAMLRSIAEIRLELRMR